MTAWTPWEQRDGTWSVRRWWRWWRWSRWRPSSPASPRTSSCTPQPIRAHYPVTWPAAANGELTWAAPGCPRRSWRCWWRGRRSRGWCSTAGCTWSHTAAPVNRQEICFHENIISFLWCCLLDRLSNVRKVSEFLFNQSVNFSLLLYHSHSFK